MTAYVNLRGSGYGAVCSPYVIAGDGLADPPMLASVPWTSLPLLARGKDVILATHGFNVNYASGVRSLARLEAMLAPTAGELFLGVLWPGDWIVPAINYPFEDGVASDAGARLGDFCDRWLASARSLSFLSHSLGARVVLAAIAATRRRVRRACLTAGAVNAGCLTEEFARAAANCEAIVTLSSEQDTVLSGAYPPGDLLADVLHPDHPPFEAALGRDGPRAPYPATVRAYEIGDAPPYGHGDYFPPSDPAAAYPNPNAAWFKSVRFMGQALRGLTPVLPN